jgi:hypothetical protein
LFKFLYQLGLIIEKFERIAPKIFWSLSLVFYIVIGSVSLHEAKTPLAQICQYQVVSKQFRCGGQGEKLSIIKKMDPDLHRRLEKYFPDWEERMAYQKNQTEFYKSARRKKKDIIKLRMADDLNVYSEKELDAINYFEGKGFYARYQDPSVVPNIYDTRQSFLLKMHDISSREKFLQSFNRINN